MIILLPDSKDGLSNLEDHLSEINGLDDKLTTHSVTVSIPKFKFEQSIKLRKTLEQVT